MRTALSLPGRTRRLCATALLVALPLATTACSEDEPVDDGVGVEEGVGEDDD